MQQAGWYVTLDNVHISAADVARYIAGGAKYTIAPFKPNEVDYQFGQVGLHADELY